MNERIKELLDWAKDHARIYVIECELANIPVVQEEYDQRFQSMFAELIVRECANIVEGFTIEQEVALDHYEEYEASDVLKEHFGVEE